MKLILQRTSPAGQPRTFGELLAEDGSHLVFTLEDMVRFGSKVHGETAIPAGEYLITLENSGRFGPETLTVNNVPGFEAIRMHGGNTERDTEGCPLLGMKQTADGINTCAPAVAMIKELVRQSIAGGEQVWMTVANP